MFESITNIIDKEKSVDVNTQFGFWYTFGSLLHGQNIDHLKEGKKKKRKKIGGKKKKSIKIIIWTHLDNNFT